MLFRRRASRILYIIRNILCLFLLMLFIFLYYITKTHHDQVLMKVSKNAAKYVEYHVQEAQPLQINTIKRFIAKYNSEQRVLNLDFFGPLKPNAPVFVVFVDKYRINLKYLLVSLSNLTGIEDALIIFSHSSFDENVNNLIKTIDFACVLQIFYPYSMQLYPNEFPGYQQGDCPRDIDIETAKSINCTGAETPDIHGRYRDPLQAQMKHYWWWTMNKVFENLPIIKDHTGFFTFLDDDVFLMEDFIYMTMHMRKVSQYITVCEFISLQSPSFTFSYYGDIDNISAYTVELTTWDPADHSAVLSFDSTVWSSIAAHYYLFCYIDDYSWSRSLYYLSLNRKDGGRFKVMSSIMPRAFKTSTPFLYDRYLEYNMINIIYKILHMQEINKMNLYPLHLEIYFNIELDEDDFVIFDYVDNSGGWNDPRDKTMCNNITTNKIKKVIMDMAHEFHQYDLARVT